MALTEPQQPDGVLPFRSSRTGFMSSRQAEFRFALGICFIVFLTVFVQQRMGIKTDQIWLMTLCDKILDGQTAYIDFIENSPPFAILLYMPAVLAARNFGFAREPTLVFYFIGLTAASLVGCGYILARAKRANVIGEAGALVAAASLLLLPCANFGQRDHFVLILALPLLIVLALRAETLPVPVGATVVAGAVAGTVVVVRPDFAISYALVIAFVATRSGFRTLFSFGELYAAAASSVVCIYLSIFYFPQYFKNMTPLIRDVYFPNHSDWGPLIFSPGVIGVLMLLASLIFWRSRLQTMPLAAVLAVAAIGVMASFFLQGKNFGSHIFPASALSLTAFAILASNRLAKPDAIILAVVSISLVIHEINSKNIFAIDLILVFGSFVVLLAFYNLMNCRFPIASISRAEHIISIACAFTGVGLSAWFLQYEWRETMPFLAEIRSIGPHPKIAAIAHLGIGLPLTSRVNGEWVTGVFALNVTDNADRIIATKDPDSAMLAKLEKYKLLERNIFLENVTKSPPDAIIVEDIWVQRHFNYPEIRNFLAGYRRKAAGLAILFGDPVQLSLYVKIPNLSNSP